MTKISKKLGHRLDKLKENAPTKKHFLINANCELAKLKKDPSAWKEHMEEHEAWDEALLDELE
jgi:hypothetical protein